MAIGRKITEVNTTEFTGGCNYDKDITALAANESPNSMNIMFDGERVFKRKGFKEINSTATGASDYGHSLHDFGVSSARKLIAHFGTTVYSMDNLDGTLDTILGSAPDVTSYNAEVKQLLIQTYEDYSNEMYWNGTDSTMKRLSTSSPGFKHAIEFQGYLLGANIDGEELRIYYEDINSMVGGSFANYFTLTGPQDDEVVGWFILNGRCYAATSTSIFRISFIGGVAVFEYKQVISDVGVVPRTLKVVVTNEFGQIALFLGTDKNVYLFDGSFIRVISSKYRLANNDTDIALEYIDDNYINNSVATYDTKWQLYRLFVTAKGNTTNTHCLNVNVNTLAYFPFDNMMFKSVVEATDDLNRRFLVGADYAGRIHKLFGEYNNDNGEVILETYESPPIMPKPTTINKTRTIDLYFKPAARYQLDLDDRTDFDITWKNRAKIDMFKNRDKFLGQTTTLGTTFKLGSETSVLVKRVNIPVTCNVYRYRLQTTGCEAESLCYYITGTVSGTGGGTSITGSGTSWTTDMTSENGWRIHIKDGNHANTTYTFDYVSATSATVSTMAAGDFSGVSYEIYKTDCAPCQKGWELFKVDYNPQLITYGRGEVLR